jgi:hypothetical protein
VEKGKTGCLNDMALYVSSQLMHVKCLKWQFCLKCILLRTCILQCTVSLLSQFCCDIINIKTVNWIVFYSLWQYLKFSCMNWHVGNLYLNWG